jgi:hypothetical protein
MMPFEIEVNAPGSIPLNFLSKDAGALFYHTPHYMSLLAHYLGGTPICFCAKRNNGEWICALPAFLSKNGGWGPALNSLPYYGSNGSFVWSPEVEEEERKSIRRALLRAFDEFAILNGCVSSTIIGNPMDVDSMQQLDSEYAFDLRDERIGQFTRLHPGFEPVEATQKLLAAMEDPRPRNIKKAQKEQVQVRWSNEPIDLEWLHGTHVENITAIGGLSKDWSFFASIPEHIPNEFWRVYIAEKDGENIAGLLLFYCNETVEYFTPATVEKHRSIQPSALVIFEAMQDAQNMGYRWWNWGGTWLSQGGVYDFKRKWGTVNLPYFYYTKILNQEVYRCSKDELTAHYKGFFVLPFSALQTNP